MPTRVEALARRCARAPAAASEGVRVGMRIQRTQWVAAAANSHVDLPAGSHVGHSIRMTGMPRYQSVIPTVPGCWRITSIMPGARHPGSACRDLRVSEEPYRAEEEGEKDEQAERRRGVGALPRVRERGERARRAQHRKPARRCIFIERHTTSACSTPGPVEYAASIYCYLYSYS